MSNHRLIHRVLLLGLVVFSAAAFAADETNIQPTLHMVTMRDGTKLATDVYVSSDCPDTDFTVKLTDVYPDGRSMLVTDGILRASLRNSFEQPELLHPGQRYELTVDLWSTSLVFNSGHRIRVAISSSNAPRFEPNPNTGGKDTPRVATNTLHVSAEHPSHILLPIYRDK